MHEHAACGEPFRTSWTVTLGYQIRRLASAAVFDDLTRS
jgi:hypothetical protein